VLDRRVDQLADTGQLCVRRLGVEGRDRPPRVAEQVLPSGAKHAAHAAHPLQERLAPLIPGGELAADQ
jgi:hypothetical protein